jgi:anti-anti-sigma factor
MPPETQEMLTFEKRGRVTIGSFISTNMLDGATVTDFGNEVLEYIKRHPDTQLLLNFQKVTYMSSAALTELLRINQALRDNGGAVRLCSLTPTIRNVFQITNLEKLFFIHDDEDLDTAHKRFERALTIAAQEEAWADGNSDA